MEYTDAFGSSPAFQKHSCTNWFRFSGQLGLYNINGAFWLSLSRQTQGRSMLLIEYMLISPS